MSVPAEIQGVLQELRVPSVLIGIINDYDSIIDRLWGEQELSSQERAVAEHFLARAIAAQPDANQQMVWFVGPGSSFINFILENTPGLRLAMNLSAASIPTPDEMSEHKWLTVLNSTVDINPSVLAAVISNEDIWVMRRSHGRSTTQRCPHPIGVFDDADKSLTWLRCQPDCLLRRVQVVRLPHISSVGSKNWDRKKLCAELCSSYLPFLTELLPLA